MPGACRIEDADTLLVEAAGVSYRVQLPDIDAPENTANPKLQRDIERTGLDAEALLSLGRRANEGLRDLLRDFAPYQLHFDPDSRDRYGRVPGELVNAGPTTQSPPGRRGYAVPVVNTDPLRRARFSMPPPAQRVPEDADCGARNPTTLPAGLSRGGDGEVAYCSRRRHCGQGS